MIAGPEIEAVVFDVGRVLYPWRLAARIVALAARRFDDAPGQMLFVDDNADYVASARKCGWHAHRFIDLRTLRRELEGCGLLI